MSERQLTVRAVARLAGVKPSVVMSWLSKANPHDLKSVDRLAFELGMTFKELLLGEPERLLITRAPALKSEKETEIFRGLCRITIQPLDLKEEE